jgi:hypothetical protein
MDLVENDTSNNFSLVVSVLVTMKENMFMGLAVPETKFGCAGEARQQFNQLHHIELVGRPFAEPFPSNGNLSGSSLTALFLPSLKCHVICYIYFGILTVFFSGSSVPTFRSLGEMLRHVSVPCLQKFNGKRAVYRYRTQFWAQVLVISLLQITGFCKMLKIWDDWAWE